MESGEWSMWEMYKMVYEKYYTCKYIGLCILAYYVAIQGYKYIRSSYCH